MKPPPDFTISAALRARKLVAQVPPDAQTDPTGEGVTLEREERRSGIPAELDFGGRYDDVVVEKRMVGRIAAGASE